MGRSLVLAYMFNGDRLAFVKAYQVKGSQPELPGLELPEPGEGQGDD